ncbi:MAG: glycosyltransferase family 2 protein [Coriobacteriia bacterium]|nr:glycosyltransferase family 2 protein [Coriobacteriia bacterium]
MLVKKVGSCRGDGNIYTKLLVSGLGADVKVSLEGPMVGDVVVPGRLYECEVASGNAKRCFVMVTPDIGIRVLSYQLVATDEHGQPIATKQIKVDAARAKWEGRLNHYLRPAFCIDMRAAEQAPCEEEIGVAFVALKRDTDANILHLFVDVSYEDTNDIEIRCYGEHLTRIPLEPIVVHQGEAMPLTATLSKRRDYAFSMRIPLECTNYLFTLTDRNNPQYRTFIMLDKGGYQRMLHGYDLDVRSVADDSRYGEWLTHNRAKPIELRDQRTYRFSNMPLFSIIISSPHVSQERFDETLASVMRQTYGQWELVTDIEAAKSEFVCLLDSGDTLEPNALFECAKAYDLHPNIDVLYSDHDRIVDGQYVSPLFKPDFSIDLLRNCDYIRHLLCIRTSLLKTLGISFDTLSTRRHDLILRAVEQARYVHHIPLVLYHERPNENVSSHMVSADIDAVKNHLSRLGIAARVDVGNVPESCTVTYALPDSPPLVSIIIPNKDQYELLDVCVRSIIEKSTYQNYEIIIVENNSTETETFATYEALTHAHPHLIRMVTWEHEFNFSKIVNFGVKHARGDYLLLLNNDTEVITPEWIELMLGICARDEVGIVGAKLYYADHTLQHAGVALSRKGGAIHLNRGLPPSNSGYIQLASRPQNLSAVTAACLMTKRSVFDEVGGFNEVFTVAFNDVDYCLKVRAKNYLVVYEPRVELYHFESVSRGFDGATLEKRTRSFREWATLHVQWAEIYVREDPYFNLNLVDADGTPNPFYQLIKNWN